MNLENSNKWLDGITYKAKDNLGASFVTKLDGEGNAYLEWTKGESDPFLSSQSENLNIASSDDYVFSYTVILKSAVEKSPLGTDFRIISKKSVSDTDVTARLSIFQTNTEGKVTLGDGNKLIAELSDTTLTTIRIAVDFAEGKLICYSDSGEIAEEQAISVPSSTGAQSAIECKRLFDSYLFYWYASSGDLDSSLCIYRITVSEGNIFEV